LSVRLVILGLLRQQPLYGYEIKHIIEEDMGDWTSIAFGSIYFALSKLAGEGMIKHVATEQDNNRPSRHIYEITKAGQKEFLRLLRETWSELERQYFAIDIGVAFIDALPRDEIKGYLYKRVEVLESILQNLNAHQQEQLERVEVPKSAAVVFEHSRAHLAAELSWTQDIITKIERRDLA
jgi:DNA-binding PadR family transcriptional regulator